MQAEAETLAHLSGTLLSEQDPVPALMGGLRAAFGCASVSVLRREGDGWRRREQRRRTRSRRAPTTRRSASPSTPTPGSPSAAPGSRRRTCTCCARSPVSSRSRSNAGGYAPRRPPPRGWPRRTSCAPRCSSPSPTTCARRSSSIKASVTSLRQRDVALTADDRGELLETIDGETDRLNNLVGNLLDMSRLQTGAVELVERDVGLEEVVPAALHSLGATAARAPDPRRRPRGAAPRPGRRRPPRASDRERRRQRVARVATRSTASASSRARLRDGSSCRSRTRARASRADKREAVFRPFQRLGDQPRGNGVGLGLAVARGFVEAMDGTLTIDDTPGGGTTVTISLPAAP